MGKSDIEIARVLRAGCMRERDAARPRVHRDPLAEERGNRDFQVDPGPPLAHFDPTAVGAHAGVDRLRWADDRMSLPEVLGAQAIDRGALPSALHAEHRGASNERALLKGRANRSRDDSGGGAHKYPSAVVMISWRRTGAGGGCAA